MSILMLTKEKLEQGKMVVNGKLSNIYLSKALGSPSLLEEIVDERLYCLKLQTHGDMEKYWTKAKRYNICVQQNYRDYCLYIVKKQRRHLM